MEKSSKMDNVKYTTIKIDADTHYTLKLVAVMTRESMLGLVRRLAHEELERVMAKENGSREQGESDRK